MWFLPEIQHYSCDHQEWRLLTFPHWGPGRVFSWWCLINTCWEQMKASVAPTLGTTLFQASLLYCHSTSGTYSLWSFCEFPSLLWGFLIAIRDLFPPSQCSDSGSRAQRDTWYQLWRSWRICISVLYTQCSPPWSSHTAPLLRSQDA